MTCYLLKSRFVISLFVVVVLMCSTLFLAVCASRDEEVKEEKNKESVEIFDLSKKNVEVQNSTGDGKADITLNKIYFPLFAAVKDDMIVTLAEAEYKTNPPVAPVTTGDNVGVISTCFEANDSKKWKKQEIEAAIQNGKTQLTIDKTKGILSSTIRTFVVNAYGEKICILLVNVKEDIIKDWEFKLVEGTVSDATEDSKKITWIAERPIELKDTDTSKNSKETLQNYKIKLFTADRSAFFIKDKNIVFVVKGESTESNKKVAAVFQFEDGGNKLELVDHDESTTDSYPTFFQWDGKIFKIPTDGSTESRKNIVKEFHVNNKSFEETTNSIARLRDFLKDKNNFFTAAIKGEKSVLLFTQEKLSGSDGSDSKKDVHLWMSDGTRVGYVGKIITGFKDISYGPVVHTTNNLFVLHQSYKAESGQKEDNKFSLTLLDGQLETIKNFVRAWKENENIVKILYKDTVTESNPCSTDGLVGFLSGTDKDKTQWTDKYHNGNANIHGNSDVKVNENGVTFNVAGAGAKWEPKQQSEQPYNFKDFGFTLVATVTVGSSSNKNSILGVGLADNTKNVGLWCTTDGHWGVSGENDQTDMLSPQINCTPNETYYVALVLDQGKIAVYVNGQKLSKMKNGRKTDITITESIVYFYFGADSGTQTLQKTDVTITDVLLYNRPCEESKIRQLKPTEKIVTDAEQTTGGDNTDSLNTDKNKTGNDSPPNTSQTINNEEEAQSSSPPPTTEDSAVRVGVVGVLCFMIFGVFTSLGRYVY